MVKLVPSLQQGNLDNEQRAALAQYKADHPLLSNTEVTDWAKKEFNLAKKIHHTTVGRIANPRQAGYRAIGTGPLGQDTDERVR